MKGKTAIIAALAALCATAAHGQRRVVQNRPYTDLRQWHFGILVGTHLQDMELRNAGPTTFQTEEGEAGGGLVAVDQDRWDAGFTVGVLGELRLNRWVQLRVAPAMYFGARHLVYRDLLQTDAAGNGIVKTQDLKTAYISATADMIFAAPRQGNIRPYVVAGLNPMLNLSGGDGDILKLKPYDVFAGVGMGCDFYLPYFKIRPEIKFMYGLLDALDTSHSERLRDKGLMPYTLSASGVKSKMVALTFYFE